MALHFTATESTFSYFEVTRTYLEYRGADEPAGTQVIKCPIRVRKRIAGHHHVDLKFGGDLHEGRPVRSGEIGNRHNPPLSPQIGIRK
ncbi:hypothetical protein LMG29739_06307 [Paraburkholderia solisilvae]|uniref:Uncharacterized protein n=1 Tax=Paraburkholderia solisilvae TaxID=624376 RepID=A0A6J5F659_9BURK|nr:hypothetical protein LMG29739_06307 [Paraburkholderia solisilvae]